MSINDIPLKVEVFPHTRAGLGLFVVAEDFTCSLSFAGIDEIVTIPAGYKTDFASIPRPFRWLLPSTGKVARPALLHDWLLHRDDKRATKIFNAALKAAKVTTIQRWIMVAFVFVWTFSDFYL
jgi:hypothetical protein